ncbi:hypothetical protein CPJCM30710_07070 [Clostridium polyendosporum]|uniref:Uncharacterized protein n=1 Tax=Clostridium polyendosporum TaxID=69208 RepID=A0A919RX84_9CLOT|nr:hypothetical protein [Clostridium polyendosporum]GIM28041.1 hypothetical protein CPJCM30710_07070 [Clostridium polyendosporum]
MSNGCNVTDMVNGWEIELTVPAPIGPSNIFQYTITRIEPYSDSRELSNIRICLCPNISDNDRTALLASCSYTVFFEDDSSITSEDCFIDNTIPNPNENPAACKGLKFDNIPSGDEETGEQTRVVLNFTLTRQLPIGPVDIGFKAGAGPEDRSGIWQDVCGPVCKTRGLIVC